MSNKKLSLSELNRISVEEFKEKQKTPLIVILDNIRSLNNVGAVFRTSDAFAIEKIYLCGYTPTPPHREIQKTAIGATQSVEWEYKENILDLISDLKINSWDIFAIEQTENSTMLQEFEPSGKLAIVMGNEVEGVQQAVIDKCNGVIEIPQEGTKHSLNISVSCGIMLWDLYRKIKFPQQ